MTQLIKSLLMSQKCLIKWNSKWILVYAKAKAKPGGAYVSLILHMVLSIQDCASSVIIKKHKEKI